MDAHVCGVSRCLFHFYRKKNRKEDKMAKIGFIGMGKIGYAILKGLLAYIPKEEVTF